MKRCNVGYKQGSKCKLQVARHLKILGTLINVEHMRKSSLSRPSINENIIFLASCTLWTCDWLKLELWPVLVKKWMHFDFLNERVHSSNMSLSLNPYGMISKGLCDDNQSFDNVMIQRCKYHVFGFCKEVERLQCRWGSDDKRHSNTASFKENSAHRKCWHVYGPKSVILAGIAPPTHNWMTNVILNLPDLISEVKNHILHLILCKLKL